MWPFLLGAATGVPLGLATLERAAAGHVQVGVGILLVAFSAYGFVRPAFKPVAAGPPLDCSVGFLNGVLGGLTGLAGILVVIWCGGPGLARLRYEQDLLHTRS